MRSAEPEGLASVVCVERRDWRAWAVHVGGDEVGARDQGGAYLEDGRGV